VFRRLALLEERPNGGVRVLVDRAGGEGEGEGETGQQDRNPLAQRAVEVAEQGDGPEQGDEREGGGAQTEPLPERAADRGADGPGYRDRRRQRREREERAREQGRDGPEVILRSGVDGP
jgi:hypothetical protein